MIKGALGAVAGLIVWTVVVTAGGLLLRTSWPAYASVAAAMTFTLPMLVARLAVSAAATLAAGRTIAAIAPSIAVRLVTGALLLLAFIPVHVSLWQRFPAWYHLTFLVSLVPLTVLGGHRRGG